VGTTTTSTGEFVLRGVPANATLEVSNVGYDTQEVSLRSGQNNITVTLRRSQGVMADVIVTGFQRIRRRNFTGAATTLKAEDVRIEGVPDVTRMLEGRAAGVSVQNVSSTFGSAPKVRIRGATSRAPHSRTEFSSSLCSSVRSKSIMNKRLACRR
jgi:hypothetical protein